VTWLAEEPSGPVAEARVTIRGKALQVVTPTKLRIEPISPRAMEHAVVESVQVLVEPDVYMVAMRAAFSVQISA